MANPLDKQQVPLFENINLRARNAGQMFEQFCKFVTVASAGHRVQLP